LSRMKSNIFIHVIVMQLQKHPAQPLLALGMRFPAESSNFTFSYSIQVAL
jgi:hypothetical protein